MTNKTSILAAATATALMTSGASAATVLLDFETAETGASFNNSPVLETELGAITLDTRGSACSDNVLRGSELGTNVLCLNDGGSFDSINFAFDVDALSGDLELRGGGGVIVQALDIDGAVLSTFGSWTRTASFAFDPMTAIRSLRIADPFFSFSGLDNLSVSAVPAPGALGLLGLGLLGLARVRRAS
ncbi:MAG: PEP-CTERM sorting domain-containing protein [Pseudomonadota bacterium]